MNQNLKKKLFDYQAEPPLTAWSRIADALDKEDLQNYPDKLYHFEEQPPAALWQKIDAHLPAKKPLASVISFFKVPAKYAAILFIAATIGLLLLLNLKKNPIPLHASTVLVIKKKLTTPAPVTPVLIDSDVNAKAFVAIPKTPLYTSSFHKPIKRKLFNKEFQVTSRGNAIFNNRYISRYTLYTYPNGERRRISRKITEWLDCRYQESNSCPYPVSQIQRVMATTSITYACDFTGILAILKLLQDQQKKDAWHE